MVFAYLPRTQFRRLEEAPGHQRALAAQFQESRDRHHRQGTDPVDAELLHLGLHGDILAQCAEVVPAAVHVVEEVSSRDADGECGSGGRVGWSR